MEKIEQITWDDLSISQVQRLTTIMNFKASAIDRSLDMLSVIYNKERSYFEEEIDGGVLHEYLNILANLMQTQPDINFDKFAEYEIWGEKWGLCVTPKQMTGGQYISFNVILEEQPNNLGLLLAMVITPRNGEFGIRGNGKKYDPEELARHLDETFPFTKARAIGNFFWQASLAYKVLTLRSTRRELMMQKKSEKDQTKRELIKTAIKEIDKTIKTLKEVRKEAV